MGEPKDLRLKTGIEPSAPTPDVPGSRETEPKEYAIPFEASFERMLQALRDYKSSVITKEQAKKICVEELSKML